MSEAAKQKISVARKNYFQDCKDKGIKLEKSYESKLKLSKSLRGDTDLPMYVCYKKADPKDYKCEGYAVLKHPSGIRRYFRSKKFTLEESKKMAIDCVNKLNEEYFGKNKQI